MTPHTCHELALKNGIMPLGPEPLVMGILNVTPDSFSDGGKFMRPEQAVRQARAMLEQGAAIIDIGGHSTRPGADEVSVQEELDRVLPAIQALRENGIAAPISIDTFRALVADQAIQVGADIINDVTGFHHDPEIVQVAELHQVPAIAMHWDKERDRSKDLMDEVKRYLEKSVGRALDAGLKRNALVLDPGFGFAKTLEENYRLLHSLSDLNGFGLPLLVGMSRKSMLGRLLDLPPDRCVTATAATSVLAYQQGAHMFRVHDVAPNLEALRVARACCYGAPQQETHR